MAFKKIMQNYTLPAAVFITGACVLIVEIVATRILAPYFGNTIYSVSSIISVVLAALSVGYYAGGRLADKYPSKKLFFLIILFSGVSVLCIQFLQATLLPALGYSLPLSSGPLIVSCLLFFLPSFILGTLSPFAIALQQRQAKDQGVGTTTGVMFFFSTVGSIAGSLLAGFVLIPMFGVTSILIGVGIVLFLLGIIPLVLLGFERKMTVAMVLLAGSVMVLVAMSRPTTYAIHSSAGLYEKISIIDGVDNGRPTRFLMQDASHSAAMYLDSDELVYDYSKYYALHELFVPKVERALVMGAGGYSIPKALLQDLPNAKVDVSEIEPSLVPLGREYFRVPDDPRLTDYIQDGRRMLHDTPHRYDLIFGDAFHSMFSVPAHITTLEFMELVRDRLNPGGVFVVNLIGSTEQTERSFIWSEIKTMQEVFAQVHVFAAVSPFETKAQNVIVVATMDPKPLDVNDPSLLTSRHQVIRELAGHRVATERMNLDRYKVLTDDYAPVDFLTASVLPKR